MVELIVFLALTGISYGFVKYLILWTERRQIMDIPNERSSHTTPTPRGGGLAIVILTLAGWLIYGLIAQVDFFTIVLPYILGGILIATISWIDDLRSLTPYQRFAAQFAGAILIVIGIGYWHQIDIPYLGSITIAAFGIIITLLWIVGLTNAYNFMDGIDGIAAGQALISGLGWVLLAWGHPSMALVKVLGLLIAGSSLGFLIHNWSPARIFMGDVGSAFLGFSFAVIPLLIVDGRPGFALVGILMCWVFLFDTVLTFTRRLIRGENVLAPHRSHLYQRLVIVGYRARSVTLLYMLFAVIGVVAARLWFAGDANVKIVIIAFMLLLCFGLWLFVNRAEMQHTNLIKPSSAPVEG